MPRPTRSYERAALDAGLIVHAGHGLTYRNVHALTAIVTVPLVALAAWAFTLRHEHPAASAAHPSPPPVPPSPQQ